MGARRVQIPSDTSALIAYLREVNCNLLFAQRGTSIDLLLLQMRLEKIARLRVIIWHFWGSTTLQRSRSEGDFSSSIFLVTELHHCTVREFKPFHATQHQSQAALANLAPDVVTLLRRLQPPLNEKCSCEVFTFGA